MAKKKRSKRKDEYGRIDTPYRTNSDLAKDYGAIPVRSFNDKYNKMLNWMTALVIFALLAAIISIPYFAMDARKSANAARENYEATYNPAFKTRYNDLGREIIRTYFAHGPVPVNLMSGVTWPGQSSTNRIAIDDTNNAVLSGQPVNVDNISFISGTQNPIDISSLGKDEITDTSFRNPVQEVLVYQGVIGSNIYNFTIDLIIPDGDNFSSRPYLNKVPTVEPMNVMVQTNQDTLLTSPAIRSDMQEDNLSDETISLISDWGDAYAQNNGTMLKRIAGDQESDWSYVGLGGFRMTGTPVINWAYVHNTTPPGEEPPADAKPRTTYAEVTFTINPGITRNSANNSARDRETGLSQTYNLMIYDANSANPRIVDWGTDWRSLSEFGHSINISDSNSRLNESAPTTTTSTNVRETGVPSELPGAELEENSSGSANDSDEPTELGNSVPEELPSSE